MRRRTELEGRLSRYRRAVTPAWEPTLNGLLLVGFIGLLGWTAWASYYVWGTGWLAGFLVTICALLRLISTRFGRTLLRLMTFVAVLIVSGGVLSIGRAEKVASLRRGARGAANGLSAEAAGVRQSLLPTPTGQAPTVPRSAIDADLDLAMANIAALCADGEGVAAPASTVPGATPPDTPCVSLPGRANAWDLHPAPDRHMVAVHEADAGLALARVEAAVAQGAAVGPAEQLLASREAAQRQAVTSSESPTPATDLLGALRAGGNGVVRRLPLVDRRGVPFELAVVGWVLVAGMGVVAYRHLEIINGADGLGPVRVKGAKADVEQFRTYLLWNVREPGAVPGASALKPVTDLLGAAASGVPGAAWLQRVLDAISDAVTIDHGYTVEFEELAEASGSKRVTLAVRVMVSRTGALVDQTVVTQPTKRDAVRSAAYRAAAVILARSRKVPAWAEWSKDTSDSLADYFLSADEGSADIGRLRDAVQKAPTSGLLCLALANAEALEGNHFRTFELALRASTIYPRYLAGRYRLALTASLLGSDPATYWDTEEAGDRARVLAALSRYEAAPVSLIDALAGDAHLEGDPCIDDLCAFALAELGRLRRDTTRRRVAFNALRQRERAYWYDLLRPAQGGKSLRGQLRQSIESCRPVVSARGNREVTESELTMQEQRVVDPRTLWLVPYNLACYHAVEQARRGTAPDGPDHVGVAMEFLETAIERPGSDQITYAWLSKDPDLAGLHGIERFTRFLDHLHKHQAAPEDC